MAALAAACLPGGGDPVAVSGTDQPTVGTGDCVVVDMAVSSEKIDLMVDLANEFNASDDAIVAGDCVVVRPQTKASGLAASLLADRWDEAAEGPRPVVWSPASSAWGAILNQRVGREMAPPSDPFMLTPLVIAMPEPMAAALGYPATPVGYADILALADNAEGWGAFGHPEWGSFRLGKTNPNFSTSGLSALIAQYYAATGETSDLSIEDLANPEVEEFARGVESAVVHYGDTTLTFLNNWYRSDARGTALTYASAVAVEEVSLINYNRGNPDGVLQPGEQPKEPRIPLVAVYPKEGTLFSDNPYIVLDADWVDDAERAAAEAFGAFVQQPENQERVLEFGFRPGNPDVPLAEPITAEFGVDPVQPQTTLDVPAPPVMVEALERWDEQRKSARVLLVIDVSGSMGEPATAAGGETKLDLAKAAAIAALDDFADTDEVGLRIFTTDLDTGSPPADFIDLVPVGPIAQQREAIAQSIRNLIPLNGTPLYSTATASYNVMLDAYDPAKINAVVLLTDGRNEDPFNSDLAGTLATLSEGSEGQASRPVRLFTIGYGEGADESVLRQLAEATNAAYYSASDPASIDRVFTAVISNF